MYKALTTFADLKDNKHLYHEGDTYPRDGVSVSEARLQELSTNKNATRKPLIVKVEEPQKKVKVEEVKTPSEEAEVKDEEVKAKPKKTTTTKRKKKEVE